MQAPKINTIHFDLCITDFSPVSFLLDVCAILISPKRERRFSSSPTTP
jgi:hypothetical protein